MSSRKTIGLLYAPPNLLQELKDKLPHYEIIELKNDIAKLSDRKVYRQCLDKVNSCEILIGNQIFLLPFINDLSPNVEWIHYLQAGYSQISDKIIASKREPTFQFTRVRGVYPQHITEYVIGSIINVERDILYWHRLQAEKKWVTVYTVPYRLLSSLSICVLGIGEIGVAIAKQCKNFGMTVYGMVRTLPSKKSACIDEYFLAKDLQKYLRKSDYVCNVLPATPVTNDILSGDVLKACKERKSVFINVGRGNLIDEESIVRAIEEQWIGGAVLDVFPKEPLPASSKLWSLPGVTITPHYCRIDRHSLITSFMDNVKLYEKGEPMNNLVKDRSKLY